MFDDDYPDYYLGDDDGDDRPRQGRRIDFAPQPSDRKENDPEEDDDEDELHDVTERDDYRGPRPGRPRRRGGFNFTGLLTVLIVVAAALTVYFRYLTPYVEESVVTGTVLNVDREGLIFKTYEATLLMPDGTTAEVSVASEDVARRMQALQGTDAQVSLECDRYYGAAPWRGKSTTVVTSMRTIGEGEK